MTIAIRWGRFGATSTAEEVTLGLDLTGKTAIVTGCNSGLGLETMRVLALRGAHVIGTGRTLEKASKACSSVPGKTTPVALELSSLQSVVECADTIARLGLPIDILVCNAGINTFGELVELVNGVEKTFVVNYLGHFVLVNRLMPLMNQAQESRIVHVGSMSAYIQAPAVGIDFDNLRGEGVFDSQEAYGRSKLANALFSLELAARLEGFQRHFKCYSPGFGQNQYRSHRPYSFCAKLLTGLATSLQKLSKKGPPLRFMWLPIPLSRESAAPILRTVMRLPSVVITTYSISQWQSACGPPAKRWPRVI